MTTNTLCSLFLKTKENSTISKEHRTNQQIRARQVYLIDADGVNVGLVDFYSALNKANDDGLDLVEMAQKDGFPLCKILDYGKWQYQQEKNKKPQHKILTKEVKVSPRIDKHDIQIKLKQISKWVEQGHKVFVAVQFKGRENSYREQGYEVLKQFVVENTNRTNPQSEGNMIFIWITK